MHRFFGGVESLLHSEAMNNSWVLGGFKQLNSALNLKQINPFNITQPRHIIYIMYIHPRKLNSQIPKIAMFDLKKIYIYIDMFKTIISIIFGYLQSIFRLCKKNISI